MVGFSPSAHKNEDRMPANNNLRSTQKFMVSWRYIGAKGVYLTAGGISHPCCPGRQFQRSLFIESAPFPRAKGMASRGRCSCLPSVPLPLQVFDEFHASRYSARRLLSMRRSQPAGSMPLAPHRPNSMHQALTYSSLVTSFTTSYGGIGIFILSIIRSRNMRGGRNNRRSGSFPPISHLSAATITSRRPVGGPSPLIFYRAPLIRKYFWRLDRRRRPAIFHRPLHDRLIALSGHRDDRRINDLSAHCQIAPALQMIVKS